MKCEYCGKTIIDRKWPGGNPKRFCSEKCRHKNWQVNNPKRSSDLHSEWIARNPKRASEILSKSNKKFREDPNSKPKIKAHQKIKYAVKIGKIQRPNECSCCHGKGKIEGHHYIGYDHPLDVIWLCSKCHKKFDREK
jgi:hypothetical protein